MPRLASIGLSWPTFGLIALIVLVVAIASGMVPTAQAGAGRLFDALRSGARGMVGSHQRARAGLVIGEVALAMMLLIGAGLLGRSLARLLDVNAGFDPSNLVTMEVQAAGQAYQDRASVQANHDRMLETVRALPGVESAALTNMLPLGGNFDRSSIDAQDKPLDNPELAPYADRYTVTTDFLRTMRIPLLRGRLFDDAEARDTSARVIVLSDALAKRIWGSEDPIGKMVRIGGPTRPWWRVIGIVANIKHTGLEDDAAQQVYTPERQWFGGETAMTLVARTRIDPVPMVATVREAARKVDPLQPISRAMTMHGVISGSTSQRRLGLILFIAFGGVALLLATAGIYGVLSGTVAERTREIGLRTALGATPGAIVGLVLKQSATLAGIGLLIGIGAAVGLSRYLGSLLYGIAPTDPVALVSGAAVITLVSLAACLAPARRAMRVDPMEALRSD
jgi:putative ABC transport system permease protein